MLFAASGLVGGLATTPGLLVAMRAVQGLGAAVLAPATLTILTTTFAEGPVPHGRWRPGRRSARRAGRQAT